MHSSSEQPLIIPVGDNCEIAGHLERNAYHGSSLFRYARSELEHVTDCINKGLQGVFELENIEPVNPTLVKCCHSGIAWHTKMTIHQNGDKFRFGENWKLEYEPEASKLAHLVTNTLSALSSTTRSVLFIYKSNLGKFEHIDSFVEAVRVNYPQLNFKLLVVKTENQKLSTSNRMVITRTVRHHAPYANAMLGGDNKGWNKILSEFISVPDFEKIAFQSLNLRGTSTGDYLRDFACVFEELDDIETANRLMKQAHNLLPNAPFVIEKLALYKSLLKK